MRVTYLESSSCTILRITRAISTRCLTSKYEVGSSKKYTSTSFMIVIAIANLWSSPPDKSSILRSSKWFNANCSHNSSFLLRSSIRSTTARTVCLPKAPPPDLGSVSTY
mmetsp:Transcript_58988/g.128066  ORF Transcript_58988/g.128066 Transcript_58988/m.128066 type:complete len:109 (+) Transcript_58988:1506-1832(+)